MSHDNEKVTMADTHDTLGAAAKSQVPQLIAYPDRFPCRRAK
jgi:hypothetical protein